MSLNNFDKKRIVKNIFVIIAFSLVLILALVLANKDRPEYTTTRETGVEYETAKVLAITENNSEIDRDTEGVLRGSAELKVEILTGRYKGDICFVTNYFSALYNVDVKPGDTVCVRIDTTGDRVYNCNIYNYNRVPLIICLLVLFFLSLAIIGGFQGIKAFAGLAYTVLCIFGILLPLTLKGVQPIPLTCGIIFFTSAVCFYLIGGFSKKTVAAALGCFGGVMIAALLAQVSANIGGISTFQMDEAEALLLLKSTTAIKLRGLFTSGILIAAMGAVMDIAMSIASALEEVHNINPERDARQLFTSGLNIGRDAMGTMANTLVLAYVGSALNMCVLIYSYGVGLRQLLCTDFVAIEIIRAIAGSVGIICAVPCVSIIAALLYTRKK
ncbi:YibE/F family protein [Butyrivibrio sp. XPD2006]|uniref:YibE/F family protein n=1 Tax=Butyrivibrio sp. XPD2006 TaxID=1280668 RepID=UPI0003B41F66|nr:YibE/F family protein [Butyrivibrio sp. XPD2006]